MEMVDLMNDLSKKADESGVMSQEDVFEFVNGLGLGTMASPPF